jgi:hypothetical protein
LLPFPTTYLCEAGFSAMTATKTKLRNWLDIWNTLRVSLSSKTITPRWNLLVAGKQAQGSHWLKWIVAYSVASQTRVKFPCWHFVLCMFPLDRFYFKFSSIGKHNTASFPKLSPYWTQICTDVCCLLVVFTVYLSFSVYFKIVFIYLFILYIAFVNYYIFIFDNMCACMELLIAFRCTCKDNKAFYSILSKSPSVTIKYFTFLFSWQNLGPPSTDPPSV